MNPPHYGHSDNPASTSYQTDIERSPQLSIIPTAGTLNFQRGYLGVEGETAAIEGEVQIKGAPRKEWHSVTVVLDSMETFGSQSTEIASRRVTLFQTDASTADAESESLPSSLPFSIPLAGDTPQCFHYDHVSIEHRLTATILGSSERPSSLEKSITVHTRRYSARTSALPLAPEVLCITDPVIVEAQIIRRNFYSGEIIPIYVTVPEVEPAIIESQALVMRSVSAELHRIVRYTLPNGDRVGHTKCTMQSNSTNRDQTEYNSEGTNTVGIGSSRVVARSGAICRLNGRRPLRIRLLVRLPVSDNVLGSTNSSTSQDHGSIAADCGSISQETLFHSIDFQLHIFAKFVFSHSHREEVKSISIPIRILPPIEPASEVDVSLDEAYHKKYDRPPLKTSRHPQADMIVDRYESGPSGLNAPPAFDDLGGAPPSFDAAAEGTSSFHPPTFTESQRDLADLLPNVNLPPAEENSSAVQVFSIEGEGRIFGFRARDEFDGLHGQVQQQLDITFDHTSTTSAGTGAAISDNVLPQVLELNHNQLPPVDDPMDPPPSIDVDYLPPPGGVEIITEQPEAIVRTDDVAPLSESTSRQSIRSASGSSAPPPYLVAPPNRRATASQWPPPYAADPPFP